MEEHFSGNGKEKGLTHLPQTVMLDFQSHSTKYFLFYFILFIKKLSEIIILKNLVKNKKGGRSMHHHWSHCDHRFVGV